VRASGLSFSLEQDAIRNVGKLSDSEHFRGKPYWVGLTSGSATEAGHRAGAVRRGSAEKKEHPPRRVPLQGQRRRRRPRKGAATKTGGCKQAAAAQRTDRS